MTHEHVDAYLAIFIDLSCSFVHIQPKARADPKDFSDQLRRRRLMHMHGAELVAIHRRPVRATVELGYEQFSSLDLT